MCSGVKSQKQYLCNENYPLCLRYGPSCARRISQKMCKIRWKLPASSLKQSGGETPWKWKTMVANTKYWAGEIHCKINSKKEWYIDTQWVSKGRWSGSVLIPTLSSTGEVVPAESQWEAAKQALWLIWKRLRAWRAQPYKNTYKTKNFNFLDCQYNEINKKSIKGWLNEPTNLQCLLSGECVRTPCKVEHMLLKLHLISKLFITVDVQAQDNIIVKDQYTYA